MGRKGRRLRKKQRAKHQNLHHLLFQRCHWSTGYGFLLRNAFKYELDIDIHNQLHHDILHDIPKPSEHELKRAWEAYQKDKYIIDMYDICQACEWLSKACQDKAFRACMERQTIFLKDALHNF